MIYDVGYRTGNTEKGYRGKMRLREARRNLQNNDRNEIEIEKAEMRKEKNFKRVEKAEIRKCEKNLERNEKAEVRI